jgi:hypothetical protein
MIKFFRHIRKSLIEENKMGKYFKYAIGEILLVVIGILIALQINNWNEERKLQNEINTYLTQKLENLKEDKQRLIEIKDVRLEKAEKSKFVLDKGIKNVDVVSFTKIVYLVVIERYFITTIERNESSTTKYYSGTKETLINKLEQLYVNKIEEMKLEESRLNTFSENAEFNLWTKGFLVDNREIFTSIINEIDPNKFNGTSLEIISNEANGQKALEAIFRRNEMANPSLVAKLNELIKINQQLIDEIEDYLIFRD